MREISLPRLRTIASGLSPYRRLATCVIASLLVAGTTLPSRAETPALAAQLTEYFLPPEISLPKLSPNGEYLGFRVRRGDNYSIGIYTFATGRMDFAGNSKNVVALNFWWKTPTRLLVNTTSLKYDAYGFTAFEVDGQKPEDVWRLNGVPGRLAEPLPDDPRHLLMLTAKEISRVDLDSGLTTTLDGDIGWVHQWVLDGKGRARAAIRWQDEEGTFVSWRSSALGPWRRSQFAQGDKGFIPAGVDPNGNDLVGWDYTQGSEVTVSRLKVDTGQRETVVRKPGLDPTHLLLLARSRAPVAVAYAQGRTVELVPLSAAQAPGVAALQKKFEGFYPIIVDNLADGKTWLVWVGNSRVPGSYFLFDSTTGKASLVALSHSAALKESLFAPGEYFTFPQRGGGTLSARIWRPAQVTTPPLVIYCPDRLPSEPALDLYEPDIQALVAQGFAVLRVNVRGTSGFGLDGLKFADGMVANSVREDLEDAVQFLTQEKVVAEGRVGLFGIRMGGVTALQIAAASPRFAAVATLSVPAEVDRYDLMSVSDDQTANLLATRLGGWSKSAKIAKEMSPIIVGRTVKIPALYLENEDSIKGRLNENGRKLRSALANTPARVETAFTWSQYPKTPTLKAQESAAILLKIGAFFEETLRPAGQEKTKAQP